MTQQAAWLVYDTWIESGGAIYQEEPFGLDIEFRSLSNQTQASPKGLGGFLSDRLCRRDLDAAYHIRRALGSRYARSVLLKG